MEQEMSAVKLVWATPDIDKLLGYMARVSNPSNQANTSVSKLLHHMMENGHVSPFDMCNFTVEVNTTRDIGRQFLRHWSIHPQEFSQRYADVTALGEFQIREFRLQDTKNRQSSIDVPADDPRAVEWAERQRAILALVQDSYKWCLSVGGAKEVARVVLPEGNTSTRMYFNGTLRSWVHYCKSRTDPATQKEHRLVATGVLQIMREIAPITAEAFFPTN
jgi:thymidylate synthase (FAD)